MDAVTTASITNTKKKHWKEEKAKRNHRLEMTVVAKFYGIYGKFVNKRDVADILENKCNILFSR